jgi:hypothetical protein
MACWSVGRRFIWTTKLKKVSLFFLPVLLFPFLTFFFLLNQLGGIRRAGYGSIILYFEGKQEMARVKASQANKVYPGKVGGETERKRIVK